MALIGRAAELRAIQAALGAAQRRPAGLVLEGDPGLGKTALWDEGLTLASQRFARVLAHRSVPAEARYAFTGLADLLTPVIGEVARSRSLCS